MIWLLATLGLVVGCSLIEHGRRAREARPVAQLSTCAVDRRVVLPRPASGTGFFDPAGRTGSRYVVEAADHVVDSGGHILIGAHRGRSGWQALDRGVSRRRSRRFRRRRRPRRHPPDRRERRAVRAAAPRDGPRGGRADPVVRLPREQPRAGSGMVSKPRQDPEPREVPGARPAHGRGPCATTPSTWAARVVGDRARVQRSGPTLERRRGRGGRRQRDEGRRAPGAERRREAFPRCASAPRDGRAAGQGEASRPTDDVRAPRRASRADDACSLPVERRWASRGGRLRQRRRTCRGSRRSPAAIHRLENDASRDADTKLSGQATLGLALARLPGRPLQTYLDRSTRARLARGLRGARARPPRVLRVARPAGGGGAVRAGAGLWRARAVLRRSRFGRWSGT